MLARCTVTPEMLAYSLVLAAGLALRLAGLGQTPLDPDEALLALAAWQVTRGEVPTIDVAPLMVFGTALLVFVVGASDAAVRLLPALAGAALPAAAWALRGPCGRWAALAAAATLALAPTLVASARRADAPILALGLVALLLIAVAGGRPRWSLAAVCSGALAACGPPGFLALATLALGGLWAARRRWRTWRSGWRVLALGLASSFVFATGGLLAPSGWGVGVWQAFVTWLLGVGDPLPALRAYARDLALYDPAVLLLVLVAALLARRRLRAGPQAWLVGGAAVLLGVASLTDTTSADALPLAAAALAVAAGAALASETAALLTLPRAATPAALGVGGGPHDACARPLAGAREDHQGRSQVYREGTAWPAIGFGLLGLAVALWLVALVLSSATLPGGPPRVFESPITSYFVLALGFVVVVCLVGLPTLGTVRARLTVLLAGLALAVALALHSATWGPVLAVGGSEAQAGQRTTSVDLANLVEEIDRHAAVWATPGRRDLPLYVDATISLPLDWYLRAYERRVARAEDARLAILPAEAARPSGRWVERRYRLISVGRVPAPGDLWRWQLYRERPGSSAATDAVLYVRLD